MEERIRALADTLIPPDAETTGGAGSGAADYMLHQLTEGDLKEQAPLLLEGLETLDHEAEAAYSRAFCGLLPAEQEALLKRLERGETASLWPMPPAEWINRMAHLAGEGFYGDPGNGGNYNEVSWKMIGFTGKG